MKLDTKLSNYIDWFSLIEGEILSDKFLDDNFEYYCNFSIGNLSCLTILLTRQRLSNQFCSKYLDELEPFFFKLSNKNWTYSREFMHNKKIIDKLLIFK